MSETYIYSHDTMIQKETDNSETRPETSNTSPHHHHNDASKSILLKPSSSTSTSATPSWSRFNDPRVVRVSKALGGKDRHSKVCTVRGLRDRRVRLSVPTAIQLYDLQERLGLNQPSKAIDWLLNAAKNEIDELPPLQIPPGMIFGENYNNNNNGNNNLQPISDFQEFRSDKQGIKIGGSEFYHGKSSDRDENHWAGNQEERQFHQMENSSNDTNNNNHALLLNSTYNSIFKLDPSNLSLSHNPRITAQQEDWHNFGLLPFQPTLSTILPGSHHHHHHQVVVYHQPEMSTQLYFPSSAEFDPKQANFQSSQLAVDSTSQPVIRPIHFNMTANLLPSQDNNDGNR